MLLYNEADIERRFTSTSSGAGVAEIEPSTRAAGPPRITGLATVFYDGTPRTEYRIEQLQLAERIMPGAFDGMLAQRQDVVGLFNHEPDNILGRTSAGTLSLSADKRGLRFSIEPAADLPLAQSVLTWIQRGEIRGNSFSFVVGDVGWKREGDWDVREIRSIERLFDVGPVTYPAYEATAVSVSGFDRASKPVGSYATSEGQYSVARLQRHLASQRRESERDRQEFSQRHPGILRPTLAELKRTMAEQDQREGARRHEIAKLQGRDIESLRKQLAIRR